jgi:hypothetical protein
VKLYIYIYMKDEYIKLTLFKIYEYNYESDKT